MAATVEARSLMANAIEAIHRTHGAMCGDDSGRVPARCAVLSACESIEQTVMRPAERCAQRHTVRPNTPKRTQSTHLSLRSSPGAVAAKRRFGRK
eukprot:1098853-Rhodomonas_salina.3